MNMKKTVVTFSSPAKKYILLFMVMLMTAAQLTVSQSSGLLYCRSVVEN